MKGVILSLPVRSRRKKAKRDFSLEVFCKKYLAVVLFTLFFATGIVWGAVVSVNAEEEFLNNMDFLFTTNLDSRLSLGMLSSFAAHFASNFVFVLACALCGFSPWGIGVLPFIIAFKGFGTGLSAAYLISTYGLKGLGFYIVVVVPGTFIFSLALTFMCAESGRMSITLARCVFTKTESPVSVGLTAKRYLFRCVYYLFLSAAGALCDMFFWSFVSGLFF